MLTRRVLLAAAAGAAPLVRAGCQTNAWRINPAEFSDLLGVLDKIKGYGYAGYETGYRNVQGQFGQARAARLELEKRGLRFLGCHIFLPRYDAVTSVAGADLVGAVIKGAASLGAERLILSGASVGSGKSKLGQKAKALNGYGKLARQAGLQLCYHNHDLEFANRGAEMEEMLRLTGAELLHLVLDAGHAWRANVDVAEFVGRHNSRIDGIHLRDYRNGDQVPLGAGEVDYGKLRFQVSKGNWAGWIINEEERLNDVKPGDEAVAPARAHVRKLFGV